jgi:uncharacterized Zn-binding protein involved in type VI secretion
LAAAVVVADDGDLAVHGDPLADEGVEQACGAAVVGGEDRGA